MSQSHRLCDRCFWWLMIMMSGFSNSPCKDLSVSVLVTTTKLYKAWTLLRLYIHRKTEASIRYKNACFYHDQFSRTRKTHRFERATSESVRKVLRYRADIIRLILVGIAIHFIAKDLITSTEFHYERVVAVLFMDYLSTLRSVKWLYFFWETR